MTAAYTVFFAVAVVLIVAGCVCLIRARRIPPVKQRTGECSICGRVLVGADWFTLTTIPPSLADIEGPGGTVMQQDFCRDHAPDLRHHG